jgi:NADH dehydrogenase
LGSLFITGYTGLIGRGLLQKIDSTKHENIYCLSRTSADVPSHLAQHKQFRFIQGDLCKPESYAEHLKDCDTVIHLAATTGKALPEEYFEVNSRGTKLLVEECERQQVKNFLYVSTIAAKFPDKTWYYYAQSKELGEIAVKSSQLSYSIIRPTIVIGKGAAIWKTLSDLAMKPVLLMLGDGTTRIQPIYIDDLIDCLLLALYERPFSNETFELGGPEEITFERLLKRIHCLHYRKEPRVVHLPLQPLIRIISFIEESVSRKLPVSAGQLYAFGSDGTIELNWIFSRSAPRMKSVNEMLQAVICR